MKKEEISSFKYDCDTKNNYTKTREEKHKTAQRELKLCESQ